MLTATDRLLYFRFAQASQSCDFRPELFPDTSVLAWRSDADDIQSRSAESETVGMTRSLLPLSPRTIAAAGSKRDSGSAVTGVAAADRIYGETGLLTGIAWPSQSE